MFKLKVVHGPNRGSTFELHEGENRIGRNADNSIPLQSSKVSKNHCTLVVNNERVSVQDQGSSNGTFVNGVLAQKRPLVSGDRLSVGEYVLELIESRPQLQNIPQQIAMVEPIQMPTEDKPVEQAEPKNPIEKIKVLFEKYVINFVYNLNEKHEWRVLMAGMFVVLTVFSAILSVNPLLERVQDKLENEAAGRAFVLARQMVDRNSSFIFEHMESKVDIKFIEQEPGVTSAYLIDMEGRILAPGRMLNQYLTDANEAAFAARARAEFHAKEKLERKSKIFDNTIAVAVPLSNFSPSAGKNVTVALGLVFFDRSWILLDPGTQALSYIQAIILSGIIAVILFFALYRLTLRPLLTLNDGIDQVLKGNASQLSTPFKMEEIAPLVEVVNATLQRVSHSSVSGEHGGGLEGHSKWDEMTSLAQFFGENLRQAGLFVLNRDQRITYWNKCAEEITGIRAESAVGSEISECARDEAFGSFIQDLTAQAPPLGQGCSSDRFEFSGQYYQLSCVVLGAMGEVKYHVILMTLAENDG